MGQERNAIFPLILVEKKILVVNRNLIQGKFGSVDQFNFFFKTNEATEYHNEGW